VITRTQHLSAILVLALLLGTGGGTAQTTAPAAPAQGIDPSLLSGLRWRSIGPARGGRSQAVAGSARRPMEYYFGAVGGGVWKTTDGGINWRPVSDRFFKSSSVGAIAVSESNPDVVYVGMGETQLRGNIIQGDGVYKSTDAGRTWTHIGLEKTRAIGRVRVHPENPDIVYVAALGDPYASTPDRGVFKSTDGGQSWNRVLFRDEKTGAVDLVLDPKSPDVMYAGLWEVFRTPHSLSSGGPGSGLFKTTDGGTTWTELTKNPGLPTPVWGKIGVTVSGADSNRLYAIIEAQDGGLFLSDDAGATWRLINADRTIRQRAFYYTRVYADPQAKDTVYVLNVAFFRSTDAGKTLRPIRVPHGDNHDLWIAPNDPKRMGQSNDGGGNISFNGGETWTDQDYPTAQFYNVITTAHVPYHVCGAQQDNSTACVPSTGGGELYAVGGGESGYIAPDPENIDVFYAGSYGGLLTRINRRTGERRNINVWPDNPMGHSASDMTERFQWTFPIVIAPTDPNVLYVTSQHVWRSTNEGQSWQKISPDLTRHDPSTMGPSGGPITLDQTGVETYGTVFTLAPSPLDPNVIWAGSDDGVVHVTRDGGQKWTKVTPSGLPDFTRISLIDASPHAAGTAYLAGNRYQRGDRAPYVYKTADYGTSWTKIVSGIPADDFPRAIREDTKRKGLLFLGTENGIYASFDDGGYWQSLRLDLPVTPVHGVEVKDNDLVIGTHGRSFYVMDNISVLRQANAAMTNEAVVLFDPADAVRSVARGVFIDYYLKEPAETVTIEILDPAGKVVRTYTGPAQPPPAGDRPAEMEEGDEGPRQAPAARVTAAKGMNRFTWDMRYPNAVDFPGLILWAASTRGPAAPPGRYQVRVTAAGATRTQDFAIERNAAVPGVTNADLQAQFALALQINQRVSDANRAVIRIRGMKDQITERLTRADNAAIKSAGESLIDKLTNVEGEIYQHRLRSGQDPLNFPIRLNNKLAALQGTVEGGDSRPTDQAQAVFTALSARLDQQLARLETLVQTDLPVLNRLLEGAGLTPVKGTI
jgi:photosystem II stability/assembly factor-like uncharacterized protein